MSSASKEYLADIVLLTMYNVDNMDLLSITPILHRTIHFANRAKELKSSDVTHVTQQDVVVRENKWRCLKYFYASGYNMYAGSLQTVN